MSDDKTALPEKNRGSSGAAGRDHRWHPLPTGGEACVVCGETKSAENEDRLCRPPEGHPALVKAAEAQELLGTKGSPETARSLADHAAAYLPPVPQGVDLLSRRAGKSPIRVEPGETLSEVLAKKSGEVPPARCKVCFGVLPYHQKGCKG